MSFPFWRSEPLSSDESALWNALNDAHARSADRANPSSVAVLQSALAAGCYRSAIIAALATFGGEHAPIARCIEILASSVSAPLLVASFLEEGLRIPGWGNGFVKGRPDPDWEKVDRQLARFPVKRWMDEITAALHDHGKVIFPNPGGYTAAVAIVLGIQPDLAPWLFVNARLPVWTRIFHQTIKGELPTWASPQPQSV